MKTMLAIETSCDETGIAYVQYTDQNMYTTLAHALNSQVDIHAPYGGVFPMVAKREHGHNLVALLGQVIQQTEKEESVVYTEITIEQEKIQEALGYLEREQELLAICKKELTNNPKNIFLNKPNIDALVVTAGPGLEPALWVGISFVKFLSTLWNIPVLPINHMEGHIASVLLENTDIHFPALSLLISGGHTELVVIENWGKYSVVGKTRDDAVGEAYDKAARILGLPYPGGPAISMHAQHVRDKHNLGHIKQVLKIHGIKLPRPMIHSHDSDFSFSGLKTAVLYLVRDIKKTLNLEQEHVLPEEILELICYEFEEAVVDVLRSKLTDTYESHRSTQTLIVAGGVIANTYIREHIETWCTTHDVICLLPKANLATDNAVMIGLAGVQSLTRDVKPLSTLDSLIARGGWRVDDVY
jgi:N6-L-threonylcarbamoyladenine synthase